MIASRKILSILIIFAFSSMKSFASGRAIGLESQSLPSLDPAPPQLQNPVGRMIEVINQHPEFYFPLEKFFWGEALERFEWTQDRSDIGFDLLNSTFSPSELLEHVYLKEESSRLKNHWKMGWLYGRFLYTIDSSLQGFSGLKSYSHIAQFCNALKDLQLLEPFSFKFDVVSEPSRQRGRSLYSQLYLDGVFGINVLLEEQHILTLGLSFAAEGVLLSQVQLTTPRGNRWMYRVQNQTSLDVYEYFVWQLVEHFAKHNINLWLIDGKSAADFQESLYAPGEFEVLDSKARIRAHYDKAFVYLHRKEAQHFGNKGLLHYRLEKRSD